MQKRHTKGTYLFAFDTLHELANYIANTPRDWPEESSRTHRAERSWDLGLGYEGAVRLAANGWPEGVPEIESALKALPPATPAFDSKADFYGHMPHVPRFCAGAPDSMIRHTPRPDTGSGKVLTLIVPVNALASVGAERMRNYGIGIAHYVNQLETEGKRVELIGCIVSKVRGNRVAHSWGVKKADQPLDLAVLAFALGHPAMFRRLGFALRERSNVPYDTGYGETVPARDSDIINCPPGAIVLNGMRNANTEARTPEQALESITKQVEAATLDHNAE